METFPKFDLFPRITKVAEGIKRIALAGSRTELCLTEHKRGGAEMLDRVMYDQPTLPLEGGRWDDCGNY